LPLSLLTLFYAISRDAQDYHYRHGRLPLMIMLLLRRHALRYADFHAPCHARQH